MPTMRLAQGEESGRPKPAKLQSSRKGESESSNSEILSRAGTQSVAIPTLPAKTKTNVVIDRGSGDFLAISDSLPLW